jgi:hypothetical protein|tara:strand:- start:584 stop:1033 length:450 start_codon:yes stop_codon:yes gene_type:complete
MPNWRKLIVSGSNASLNSLEVVHATGSFTGSFIGDGSLLTNVVASGSIQSASIAIRANTLSPAATASFSDISTLARAGSGSFSGSFQGDGSNLTGISAGNAVGYSNLITLAADYTTAANSYNSLYGPLTIGSGVNVTIAAGSFLKIEDF